jgi:hypothetical protein
MGTSRVNFGWIPAMTVNLRLIQLAIRYSYSKKASLCVSLLAF